MSLIILLVLAGLFGYLLARSQAGERLNQGANDLVGQARTWGNRTAAGLGERLRLSRKPPGLRGWAAGSPDLDEGTRRWLAGQTEAEAAAFAAALDNHAESLGLDLNRLFSGMLDSDDQQRKVYVEAVSIYSQAYRKAREIQQEEDRAEPVEALEGDVVEGKTVAEKKPSRRQQSRQAEEAASGA
jgi:hypothetical protein